jgi:hypothetical protein
LCYVISWRESLSGHLGSGGRAKGGRRKKEEGNGLQIICKRIVSRTAAEFNLQRSHPSGAQVLGLATIQRAPDFLPNEYPSLDLLKYFGCTLSNYCHPPKAPWKFRSSESLCQDKSDKQSGPSDYYSRKTFGARSPSPCTLLDLCLRRVLLSSLSVYLYLYIFARRRGCGMLVSSWALSSQASTSAPHVHQAPSRLLVPPRSIPSWAFLRRPHVDGVLAGADPAW